jgi:hypothetical protein
MKIISKYNDIIDYLQTYDNDDKIFYRAESTVIAKIKDWKGPKAEWDFYKHSDNAPLPRQLNMCFNPTSNVYTKPNLFESVKAEQKELESFGFHGTFHFIPTGLKLPIALFLRGNTTNENSIIIKNKMYKYGVGDFDHMSKSKEFSTQLLEFFKNKYKSNNLETSIKPICFITCPVYDGKYVSNINETVIWVNPPLVKIPNLINHFNSYEELYQEIEQYLWNDVEMQDPMINITNNDRIISHGFDLKTSFRKEKNKK